MAYAIRRPGGWEEIVGPFEIDGVQYPANWPECASGAERAAVGILPIGAAPAEPQDVQILTPGQGLGGDDVPVWEWLTEPYPLETARAIVWARAKALRNARMIGGCATPLGRMDTSDDSQRKLNGAVTSAILAQLAGVAFAVTWTMADNSAVAHDGPQIIAAGIAVSQHVATCQNRGTALRGEIEATDDPFAIDLTTGWPA